MNKEQFKKIIDQYKIFTGNAHEYYKFGVDLYESKFPIGIPVENMVHLFFMSIYNEDGLDWITWFMYENEFGEAKLDARDGDKLICQTVDDLYDYIEQYKLC